MTDDLISRQAVVDEIHKYFLSEMDKEETKPEDGWEVYANMPHVNELLTHNKQICTKIKALPPTDISAKKVGEWTERKVIEDGKAIEEWQSARCSVCGKIHTTPYLYYFDDFAYCPNCGAEMFNGEEEE